MRKENYTGLIRPQLTISETIRLLDAIYLKSEGLNLTPKEFQAVGLTTTDHLIEFNSLDLYTANEVLKHFGITKLYEIN